MKNLVHIVIFTITVLLLGDNARAFTYSYWDGATDSPPGGQNSPNGTWENANWATVTGTTAPANSGVSTTATQNYVESSDAHFSAGTASTGTYTITVDNAHTVSGFDLDTVGNCTLAGPGVLSLTSTGDGVAVNTGATLTISNVIAGTAGGFINMSKPGYNGTLVLGGVNTFTGASGIGGVRCVTGTVVANNDLCFGTGANSYINMDGGTLSFPAGTHTVTNGIRWDVGGVAGLVSFLAGSGTVNFNGPCSLQSVNVSPPYIICNGTGDVFFNGVVSDTTRGALLVSGPGAGRIIFTAANTYTGYLYLERANFAVGNNSSINGQLHIDGVYASTFLQAYGAARTISKVVVFDNYQFANNANLGVTMTGTNPLTMSGVVDLYTNNPSESIVLANTADTIISGQILSTSSGAGTGSSVSLGASRCGLNIIGPGRLVFKNINNTYTGDTVVYSGTLCLQNASGNATGTGTVQLGGGTLSGTGFAGLVSVNPNGIIQPGASLHDGPGTLTTGNQTWEGGGHYAWEINNGNATEGADPGWSKLVINGALNITANSGSPFNIDITSLTTGDVAGTLAGLSSGTPYTWRILTASGGISGFSPDAFSLNTGNFSSTLGGAFSISQNGNDLDLTYTASPYITTQPQDQLAGPGNSATLTVGAAGAPLLVYQWYQNGAPISGANASSYTIPDVEPPSVGNYFVTVTNTYGSAVSSNAYLYVTGSPTIVVFPQSQTNYVGGKTTFSVLSSGSPPLIYTWYLNDSATPIDGATGSSYTTANLQMGNNGDKYSVDVANGFGDQPSPDAILTVTPFVDAHFTSITGLTNQPGINLTAVGNVGGVYNIQASTNLASTNGWTVLGTSTNVSGTFQYLDTTATNKFQRFYRTQLQQ